MSSREGVRYDGNTKRIFTESERERGRGNRREQKNAKRDVKSGDDLDTSSLKTGNSVTYFNTVITCAPGGINPKFTLKTSEFSVIKRKSR